MWKACPMGGLIQLKITMSTGLTLVFGKAKTNMTDKCKYCGKEVKGQEKYRGAEITHAACIYKAMAPIRAKVTQFRKGK